MAKAVLFKGNPPDSASRKRFDFYCVEWLCLNKARIKKSTYAIYLTAIAKHIKPGLGGCTVSALSTALILQFGQELLDDGPPSKTV